MFGSYHIANYAKLPCGGTTKAEMEESTIE